MAATEEYEVKGELNGMTIAFPDIQTTEMITMNKTNTEARWFPLMRLLVKLSVEITFEGSHSNKRDHTPTDQSAI
jgi:hypothetical protein